MFGRVPDQAGRGPGRCKGVIGAPHPMAAGDNVSAAAVGRTT